MVCTPVKEGAISLNFLGTNGLFVAIIIGLLVVEINRLFEVKQIKLKLPDTVPPMVATLHQYARSAVDKYHHLLWDQFDLLSSNKQKIFP